MRIVELEAKQLLREEGLNVPEGRLVNSVGAAVSAFDSLGAPVVIKSQIPIGGRMKAGGIRFAETAQEAMTAAEQLLGSALLGFVVEEVLVEQQIEAAEQIYLGITYDSESRRAVILGSRAGGVDVEQATEVIKRPISSLFEVAEYTGREAAVGMGFSGREMLNLSRLIGQLVTCFGRWDALTLELNPVILDADGHWWVADAHLELDDDALYRQTAILEWLPLSAKFADQRSEFERRAIEIDLADHRGVAGRLVPFPGTLGVLIGGGGASLTSMDALLDAELEPANYCEIGGNPSVWKIKELTKLILEQRGVERLVVIMNVVSNTRVDLVARGVIKGILEAGRSPEETIAAFRVPGSWEEEGRALLEHYGVRHFGRETTLDEVVEAIRRDGHTG